ncbi:hypothetical protein HAZT_HAZT000820 [Hyalella azteca]|uniref:Aldehyde dehydrogenase domain-containing protein n=1 Tax=Hyalella azteca TaxID=294128 RepID=A0A6A0GX68_HYAAZ|nr:hypothetical protein HAZT_HAZT000820 [Hyalella azteca]
MFIENKWQNSSDGATCDVINPATEELICKVQIGNESDVNAAVAAARRAFQPDAPWRLMDASQRGRLMEKLCDLIERDRTYLASLETIDSGKAFSNAYDEMGYSVDCLRYYAGWCDKIHGTTVPCDGEFVCMTRREPVGVVGQIIPWNYPLMMVAWKLGPALATGCTIVLKPSELTPLSALYVASLVAEAGFPPGVVNIVVGYGVGVGTAITNHPDVDKVAFTGSTAVGRDVMRSAAVSNLKRCTFELGGKSPLVVCEDCHDLDEAVKISHNAIFGNHGQNCCAGSRTFVHESIYDEFVKKATELAKKRVLGDPFAADTQQGPQVSQVQMNRILKYIDSGVRDGAKVEFGGARWGNKGFFVSPTVFSGVTDDMTIAKEEIFGPVQSILKYSSFDDVIRRANATSYGLASGILTKDITKALYFAKRIQAGSVWGESGLDEYLEDKTITIKVPAKL